MPSLSQYTRSSSRVGVLAASVAAGTVQLGHQAGQAFMVESSLDAKVMLGVTPLDGSAQREIMIPSGYRGMLPVSCSGPAYLKSATGQPGDSVPTVGSISLQAVTFGEALWTPAGAP